MVDLSKVDVAGCGSGIGYGHENLKPTTNKMPSYPLYLSNRVSGVKKQKDRAQTGLFKNVGCKMVKKGVAQRWCQMDDLCSKNFFGGSLTRATDKR